MKRSLAILAVSSLMSTSSAYATGAIDCHSADGEASVSLTIGSLPILAVVGAQIVHEDKLWAIGAEGDNAILSGQAFGNMDQMRVDFTDINVERIVAELRLFTTTEGVNTVTAGTLRIADIGAFAISCVGP